MKLLMLVNPRSGMKNSKAHLLDAIDVFCKNGYTVTTYVTQSKDDAEKYLLKNRTKFDIVCVFGGDGTMNEVTNALMRKEQKPLLGYFPSGTMNDFGSNFDLGNDLKTIAEKIVLKQEKPFDVGLFNDRYFNYVAAFGAMCDVPFKTDRNAKEVLGNIAYILEGISHLPDIRKIPVRYTLNGKEYKRNVLFGLIYSGNRVAGMVLDDKNKGKVDDGKFNVLLVDYVPSIFESTDLFDYLTQKNQLIHRYQTDHITLEFEDDEVVWTLDGEEARTTDRKADITITNKALRLLA